MTVDESLVAVEAQLRLERADIVAKHWAEWIQQVRDDVDLPQDVTTGALTCVRCGPERRGRPSDAWY